MNDNHISFRLPTEILAKLRKSAAKNQRSVSAEIVYRLINSFEGEKK